MADTTVVKQTFIDTVLLDSISHQLTLLQNSNSDSIFSLWIPLIASVIGGMLVIAGQALDKQWRLKEQRKNSALEIYSFCRKLEATMKNHYRELAMFKFHVEYWWHCYLVDRGDTPHKQNAYEEHLQSQAYARDIERQIGITKADFIGHVRKFQMLEKLSIDIENHIEYIADLTNPKAKSYDSSVTHHKLRYELAEKEERELRERYYQNLAPFKAINDVMKQHLIASK